MRGFLLSLALGVTAFAQAPAIIGFSPAAAKKEVVYEARFRASLTQSHHWVDEAEALAGMWREQGLTDVQLANEKNGNIVSARIAGSEVPEQSVVVTAPMSDLVSITEAITAAMKSGLRPRRTLIFASPAQAEFDFGLFAEGVSGTAVAVIGLNLKTSMQAVPQLRPALAELGAYPSEIPKSAFLQNIGVPTIELPSQQSEVAGALALRLANAEILPFDFQAFAVKLRDWVDSAATESARKHLDFAPLYDALKEFDRQAVAAKVTVRYTNITNFGLPTPPNPHRELNDGFRAFEQGWLVNGQHLLYGVRELPALNAAIDANDWPRAQKQIQLLADTIKHQANELRKLCTCEV